jgi:hypothetical protein
MQAWALGHPQTMDPVTSLASNAPGSSNTGREGRLRSVSERQEGVGWWMPPSEDWPWRHVVDATFAAWPRAGLGTVNKPGVWGRKRGREVEYDLRSQTLLQDLLALSSPGPPVGVALNPSIEGLASFSFGNHAHDTRATDLGCWLLSCLTLVKSSNTWARLVLCCFFGALNGEYPGNGRRRLISHRTSRG